VIKGESGTIGVLLKREKIDLSFEAIKD